MKTKKIFIDTDVILDFIAQRKPYAVDADRIFSLIDQSKIQAFTSSVSITNLYYLLENTFKVKNTREIVKNLTNKIDIHEVSESHIINALNYAAIKDFEDCVQIFCAIDAESELLVTRNKKDFKNNLNLQIMTPAEFLLICIQ